MGAGVGATGREVRTFLHSCLGPHNLDKKHWVLLGKMSSAEREDRTLPGRPLPLLQLPRRRQMDRMHSYLQLCCKRKVQPAVSVAVVVTAAGTVAAVIVGWMQEWQLESDNWKQQTCSCCTWGSLTGRPPRRRRK